MRDLLVGSSAITEKLPISGCLGDLVRGVEKFEVHARDPG